MGCYGFFFGGGGGGSWFFSWYVFRGATTNPQISINTTEGKRLGRGEKKLIARIRNDWAGAGREERRWHTFTFLSILCSSYLALKESTKSIHLLNLCWIFVKCTYFMSLLKVCYQSVFAESLKLILLWIEPSYFSAFSLENMCDSWCMHQTGLSSSAAIVPQSKFTGLCSSASTVPWSISTEM